MNQLHSFEVPRDDTHASAPSDVLNAMGDTSFDVYSMQQCNPWQASSGLCDFSPAFAAEAASAKSALGGNFFKNQAKSNIKNAAAAAVALRGAKKDNEGGAAAAAAAAAGRRGAARIIARHSVPRPAHPPHRQQRGAGAVE